MKVVYKVRKYSRRGYYFFGNSMNGADIGFCVNTRIIKNHCWECYQNDIEKNILMRLGYESRA